ncbi:MULTISPECIES: heparinase II/III family protein [Acidocella]|uniref:heparinase II/III family protein n=1 Tax=Acidocella TaxID=50709 RepID=UPI00028C83E8|nr:MULTISPECIES: heparinase II/III family protein [Acidocella]EKN00017.1 heparinase II/III family protein [Acidocella sp. MX-AZ02]
MSEGPAKPVGLGRQARTWFTRLQNLRPAGGPDAPALSLRDPWPGDPARGARLVKAELEFGGAVLPLHHDIFSHAPGCTRLLRAHLHGFTWLRDLRALGTDAARSRARALAMDYMDTPKPEPISYAPDVVGARLAAWLGHYDFFAASADDAFRQALMHRLVQDARTLSAALPAEFLDGRALTALKGLAAASIAMPEHVQYLPRVQKILLPELARQFYADGGHIERSPAAHLLALQDLTEIRALMQAGSKTPPTELVTAIEHAAAALRALRHGDGGLPLFNGSQEELATLVDLVLAQAGRARGTLAHLKACGLFRLAAGKAVLFMDAGVPTAPGLDRFAHAGTLGFEYSFGKDRLIVNCGAAPALASDWAGVLRGTAAHSTLIIADTSSAEIKETGLGRRPLNVNVQRQEAGGIGWIEANHDGWSKPFGAIHHRRLGLSENGEELQGEDLIEAETPQPFAIRFHLHPNVTASLVQDDETVLLRTPSGRGFRLKAEGAAPRIEESVYFGQAEPRRAEQIVLPGHQDGPQHIKWTITKA